MPNENHPKSSSDSYLNFSNLNGQKNGQLQRQVKLNIEAGASILIIGAGPIIIGQGCEFDYSGTQACKILKSLGFKVILINPNPATIMTDPETADIIYIEPIHSKILEQVIAKERPQALLPTVGGQTALNAAMELEDLGILKKYNIKLIGAKKEAIENAEKRSLFNKVVNSIGLKTPKNITVNSSAKIEEAFEFIGVPAIIRPSFTLGGLGSGIVYSKQEFFAISASGMKFSPINEIQIDEFLLGWKEFELEVIRDKNDNCIVVCAIENIDPMGVHTGDSVTVAPVLTLRDKEYQEMRDASFKIMRSIGADTGGSNVQFAVNPNNGALRVIEMNPRVSRSSALASKATGYPIAKVAAQLAVGYTLNEIRNDAVPIIPASFEPALDYIVVKIPYFNFEKFPNAKKNLSSSMKSIGEVMAIARSFPEALQKALCSLEQKFDGLSEVLPLDLSISEIKERLTQLSSNKILIIAEALRRGLTIEEIHELTKYDYWFLSHIRALINAEEEIKESLPQVFAGLAQEKEKTKISLLNYKKLGFSDSRIAKLVNKEEAEVRALRQELKVWPVYKHVDTCAAEFSSDIAYLYSTYEGDGIDEPACEAAPSNRKKVIVLGSGPNRIGQGIEFDYSCVHAILGIKELGLEAIMLNCNPETVSTDYDISDKLYFTPLTLEHVLDIIEKEQLAGELLGVILQFGGQTPLKLAKPLQDYKTKILGTSFESIDISEDRNKFNNLVSELGLKKPDNIICHNIEAVRISAEKIGFPLIIRPSYVLGGRAMAIIYEDEQLEQYLAENIDVLENGPLLIDKFLLDAVEIDVDAICDSQEVYIAGIMEHIEEAGVHSGDSAFVLPPQKVSLSSIEEIKKQTEKIALALKVIGLINIQFAIKEKEVFILEVNPRASRTVPFIAKATNLPISRIATKVILGQKLKSFNLKPYNEYLLEYIFVKQPVFAFEKFPGADILLGPEMKSTGEVMGIAHDFASAFAKAYIASGNKLPTQGNVFLSVKDEDKEKLVEIALTLANLGFELFATYGTAKYLGDHNIPSIIINKVKEGTPHIVDMILEEKIDLVINTTSHYLKSIEDSLSIRSSAVAGRIPCSTNIHSALALVNAIKKVKETGLEVYRR